MSATTKSKASKRFGRRRVWAFTQRHLPILDWDPHFERTWLRLDLIAALVLWGTGVPTALAYAQLAGMPASTGLYTAFMAMLLYGIFATSSR